MKPNKKNVLILLFIILCINKIYSTENRQLSSDDSIKNPSTMNDKEIFYNKPDNSTLITLQTTDDPFSSSPHYKTTIINGTTNTPYAVVKGKFSYFDDENRIYIHNESFINSSILLVTLNTYSLTSGIFVTPEDDTNIIDGTILKQDSLYYYKEKPILETLHNGNTNLTQTFISSNNKFKVIQNCFTSKNKLHTYSNINIYKNDIHNTLIKSFVGEFVSFKREELSFFDKKSSECERKKFDTVIIKTKELDSCCCHYYEYYLPTIKS